MMQSVNVSIGKKNMNKEETMDLPCAPSLKIVHSYNGQVRCDVTLMER
jgi:hypothetical protein